MNRVVLSEDAFIMMVASAFEVYKKECYGILVGNRWKKDFYIHTAVPYQTAEATPYSLAIDENAEKRLLDTLNFFKGYKYIGEYHSHTDYHRGLSETDRQDLMESGAGISILIVVEPFTRYRPWKYVAKDKTLTGTVEDRYRVLIKAYMRDAPSRRIIKLRLRCDFLKKLNRDVRKRGQFRKRR